MMFIRWDFEKNEAIGLPNNKAKGPDWLPCVVPPMRTSAAQSLKWELVDGVVRGRWIGSPDPQDGRATNKQIKAARLAAMQEKITVRGMAFQFDRDSRDLMAFTITGLRDGETTEWRLADNTAITVNSSTLKGIYDELMIAMADRVVAIDREYVEIKAAGATVRDVEGWRSSHR